MLANSNYSFQDASLPGVTIINSNSPEFLPAVNSLVDPTILSNIQAILPFSYVLKNNTSKFIIVYSTRWTLTDPSGQVTTQDRTGGTLSTLRDGDAIAPGASRLVSPIFRLGVRNAGPAGSALSQKIERTIAAFSSKAKVEISLETVIFEDGKAVGTDATNATAQAQACLDAERQVLEDLAAQKGSQSANADVKQLLSGQASGPRAWPMSNPPQYDEGLAMYRHSLATTLLRQLQQNSIGTDALSQIEQSVESKRNLRISR
jgi:hypothetical protein